MLALISFFIHTFFFYLISDPGFNQIYIMLHRSTIQMITVNFNLKSFLRKNRDL